MTDVSLIEKYSNHLRDTVETNTEKMFLKHSIKMVICYKMILDRLESRNPEELLQQLAISHGLLGITGEEFKVTSDRLHSFTNELILLF